LEHRDAQQLAERLMAEFGLTAQGWRFEWDDAERRFGCCHHGVAYMKLSGLAVQKHDPFISLSRSMTLLNDAAQVEDTIRHEIAHAMCKPPQHRVRGQKLEGHGEEWKRMCAVTGARPVRCYSHADTVVVKQDWSATCGGCGTIFYKKKQPRAYHTFTCPECKRKKPFRFYGEKFPLVFVHCRTGKRHDLVEHVDTRGITNAIAASPTPEARKAALDAMKRSILIAEIAELEERKK